MKIHPYSQLPDRNFWRRYVSDSPWRELNLNDRPKFQLKRDDLIATAGSCFAQHISRYLSKCGVVPYVAEPAHPLIVEFGGDVESYRLFSARYGNIYTARQCLELFDQAFGKREVIQDFVEEKGRWFDLLRPNVGKSGYECIAEAAADRAYHLQCVREMFKSTTVFVFTLGLTESWRHSLLGHTYPVCPGTVRGVYAPSVHRFHQFTFLEVLNDLDQFIQGLESINPEAKIILTVSPVPLVATHTGENVLVASSYSKSVLRAAVGEIEARYSNVAYFPSYEIISHPASFGQYLASDLREVTERGVSHVMGCFIASFFEGNASEAAEVQVPLGGLRKDHNSLHKEIPLAECEELFNDQARP